jgi:hypothetical protein
MKKLILLSIVGLFSLQLNAQNRELGIYLSPVGIGYTNWAYQNNSNALGTLVPRRGNGFNGNVSGHITYRFSRLRVGAEGGFNYTYIDNTENLPTNAETILGMSRRNIKYGGARVGLDLFQFPFFTFSPNASLGLFGFNRDDFSEEARRKYYTRYGLMFEFKLLPRFSVFAEPSIHRLNYKIFDGGNREKSIQNNYNLNLGVGLRL